MSPRVRGWWLVGLQFGLLGLLLLPLGERLLLLPHGLASAMHWLSWTALLALVVAGLTLGRGLTAHPSPVPGGELVTGGLYRWLRHPIYTFLLIAAGAIAVADASLAHLAAFAGLVVLLNYKARFEEGLLRDAYPGYAEYAAKTGRFLPRLRRRGS